MTNLFLNKYPDRIDESFDTLLSKYDDYGYEFVELRTRSGVYSKHYSEVRVC